ncbi:MAG: hypothetical protein AAF747_07630 [Planctomycetota bacterium]
MSRNKPTTSLIAGLFLFVGVIGAVAISFYLGSASLRPSTNYVVALRLDTGSAGLESGAAVRVGGDNAGRVTRVEIVKREDLEGLEDARVAFFERAGIDPNEDLGGDAFGRTEAFPATFEDDLVVRVDIAVDSRITLDRDARVDLIIPLLGSGASLNIPYTGSPDAGELAEGGVIVGQLAAPTLLYQAGLDPQKISKLFDSVSSTAAGVEQIVTDFSGRSPRIAANVDTTVQNARDISDDAREQWPTWQQSITKTTGDFEQFGGRLGGLADNANGRIDALQDLIGSAQSTVDDNRPAIDQVVSDVQAVTGRVREEWLPLGTETLSNARDATAEIDAVSEQARAWVAAYGPIVDRTLASGRLAADQLRLLMSEVRLEPWRILVRPTEREMENQLLYDAARSYGEAVADMRETSVALEALLAGDAQLNSERMAVVRQLSDRLSEQVETYKDAERDLLDRMINSNPQ